MLHEIDAFTIAYGIILAKAFIYIFKKWAGDK